MSLFFVTSRAPTSALMPYLHNIIHLHRIFGGRAYPVQHYPVALRLRYRKDSAILCVVLIPQSGDSSGTTLGVRSVALLHLGVTASKCSPYFSSSQLFAKSVIPFAITFAYTIMSKLLLCCKSQLQIDKIYLFCK